MSAEGIENCPRVKGIGPGRSGTRRKCFSSQAVSEVPCPFYVCRHGRNKRIAFAQPGSLVVAKDESAILFDRAAQKCAKLIPLEGLLTLVEIIDGIQFVVT